MEEIPKGLCQCGCGQRTNIAPDSHRVSGAIKGQPYRFIRYHHIGIDQEREKNPNWNGGKTINSTGYSKILIPGHAKADEGGYVFEHILIAEKSLGHNLPTGAIVHHHPKNPSNSLVICQNRAYHRLLHRKYNALISCGHANWRQCYFCRQYDSPNHLYIPRLGVTYHKSCENKYRREICQKNKVRK